MKNNNMNIVHREKTETHTLFAGATRGAGRLIRSLEFRLQAVRGLPEPGPRERGTPNGGLRHAALLCAALALTGGCTLRQSYPETEIRGYINGQPFAIHAPKDSTLTGFDAVAETNGAVHVHIDKLQCSLNSTNLMSAATGEAAIVTAVSQGINQAIQTGSAIALKAATP